MESTNFATRYYSSSSLNDSKVFYLTGSVGVTYAILDLFTSLLINSHCTFFGFAETIVDMINRNNSTLKDLFNIDYLAKRFGISWISYQLAYFELMLGKSHHTY